jgi:hypothetical protein
MTQAIRELLAGVVDYAGLFPPAALEMPQAVTNYAAYREDRAAWMLGRFIVPVARLAEFEQAAAAHLGPRPAGDAWPISALAGDDLAADVLPIGEFNCRHAADGAGAAVIDTIEVRAASADRIEAIARAAPPWAEIFVEIPLDPDPAPLIAAIARAELRAKARTGGVTPEAIPDAGLVARFLARCIAYRVPFKATAGLHHPLRAEYPLTYDAGALRGTMHGYLNVLLASTLLQSGGSEEDARRLLEECHAEAFQADGSAVGWRGRRFTAADAAAARRLARSFGSCSFTEPVEDLATLNLG